jgi:hypothetical protein
MCWARRVFRQIGPFSQQTPASQRVQGILSEMQARSPQVLLERQAAIAAQRARFADLLQDVLEALPRCG